jgi:xanthine dehydrogenase accessory factor
LFVFGAGDDSKPLVTMACLLGWSVKVIDGRAHLARNNRFPDKNAEVLAVPDLAIQQIDSRDAVVIMTHGYEQDRDCLASLLPARPKYLGLLGSRQRSSLLIAEAASKLEWSVSECCQYICAPIGLDIGGEGPEAIALAIIAEAQRTAWANRLSAAGSLRIMFSVTLLPVTLSTIYRPNVASIQYELWCSDPCRRSFHASRTSQAIGSLEERDASGSFRANG